MSLETIIIATIAMAGTLGGGWFAFKQGYANTLNKRENDLWARIESENAKLRATLDKLMDRMKSLEEEKEESDLIIEALTARIVDLESQLSKETAQRERAEELAELRRVEILKLKEQGNGKMGL